MHAYVYTFWPSTRRCREASSLFQDFWTPPAPHFVTSPFLAPNIPLTIGGWRFWSREKSRAADEIKKKMCSVAEKKCQDWLAKWTRFFLSVGFFNFEAFIACWWRHSNRHQTPPPQNDRRRWCVPRFHGGSQYAMSNVHWAFTHAHTNIYIYAWIYTT